MYIVYKCTIICVTYLDCYLLSLLDLQFKMSSAIPKRGFYLRTPSDLKYKFTALSSISIDEMQLNYTSILRFSVCAWSLQLLPVVVSARA